MNKLQIKEVVINETCFGQVIDIDGVEFNDIPKEKIIEYIKSSLGDDYNLREVFLKIIELNHNDVERESYGSCETCGHWGDKVVYTM